MSAFLILQNTSQVKRIERDKKVVRKPRSSDSTSVRSGSTSSGSSHTTHKRVVKTPLNPSVANSTTESYVPLHERKKKVFDLDTSSYVYKTIPLSPLAQKISEFEQKFEALAAECKYHRLNQLLNKYRKDSGELLFSIRNVHILRYSYFEQFINDYQLIQLKANQFKRNGAHKLKYMRKIAKITMIVNEVKGFPSMLTPLSVDNVDDLKTDDESEGDDEHDEEMDMLYRLQKFSLTDHNPDPNATRHRTSVTVRSLFRSKQFWNNVYQDLKYDSIQVKSTFNYFELLPPIHHTMNFFGELVDYLLYNLFILSGDPTNLESLADVQTIQNYNFFYFKDFSYQYVNLMRREHFKMYHQQSVVNGSMRDDRKKSSFESEVDLETHRVLMAKLVETIMENMKTATSISQSSSNMNSYDDLFVLWDNLLRFIMCELIINERDGDVAGGALDEVSERAESEHDDDASTSSIFRYYEMSSTKSKTAKINRNESISSKSTAKSTDHSIMSGPRFDSIASSMSSTNIQGHTDLQTILAASSNKTGDSFDDTKTAILPAPRAVLSGAGDSGVPPSPSKKKRSLFSKFKRADKAS